MCALCLRITFLLMMVAELKRNRMDIAAVHKGFVTLPQKIMTKLFYI